MSETSDRVIFLLQELALLKEAGEQKSVDAQTRRKRRKEIRAEIKQLALEKKRVGTTDS